VKTEEMKNSGKINSFSVKCNFYLAIVDEKNKADNNSNINSRMCVIALYGNVW